MPFTVSRKRAGRGLSVCNRARGQINYHPELRLSQLPELADELLFLGACTLADDVLIPPLCVVCFCYHASR